MRVIKHWHKLPRKAVELSSLEIFKSCLEKETIHRLRTSPLDAAYGAREGML